MKLQNKDLNLLFVFSAIWQERNLSRAAETLHLSQSAVSHALKRLREEFNDSLFVRSSKGVSPTDFAIKIAPEVLKAIDQLEALYSFDQKFDLKQIERTLLMATGDYFSMTGLSSFMNRMNQQAPKVRVICKPVAKLLDHKLLEQGEIHLGITAIPIESKEGLYSKTLYKDKMACCVCPKHPIIKGQVTLDKYLKAEHINVSNFGKESGVADRVLAKYKKVRAVKAVVASFFDAGRVLQQSDLVLSAPKKMCEQLSKDYNLKTFDLDFAKGLRPISMVWHERTHQDPFHQAIRSIIK